MGLAPGGSMYLVGPLELQASTVKIVGKQAAPHTVIAL